MKKEKHLNLSDLMKQYKSAFESEDSYKDTKDKVKSIIESLLNNTNNSLLIGDYNNPLVMEEDKSLTVSWIISMDSHHNLIFLFQKVMDISIQSVLTTDSFLNMLHSLVVNNHLYFYTLDDRYLKVNVQK